MRHSNRWDLPKGHMEAGETELACALREMQEETGVDPAMVELQSEFRFQTQYTVRERRFQGAPAWKTLVIFLAVVRGQTAIKATEHIDAKWVPWSPPHQIQLQTIDPVLQAAEQFFASPQGIAWSQAQLPGLTKGK